jgi:hypothetical protein
MTPEQAKRFEQAKKIYEHRKANTDPNIIKEKEEQAKKARESAEKQQSRIPSSLEPGHTYKSTEGFLVCTESRLLNNTNDYQKIYLVEFRADDISKIPLGSTDRVFVDRMTILGPA